LPLSSIQNVVVVVRPDLLQSSPRLLQHQTILQNFYKENYNQPLWLNNDWKIRSKKVFKLLGLIKKDLTLNYRSHLRKDAQKIEKDLEKIHSQKTLIELELQLTHLYYEFLQHKIYGEIQWNDFQNYLTNLRASGINAEWVRYPLNIDIIKLMSHDDIEQTITLVQPKGYHYKELYQALTKLYQIKWRGGWKKLPPFKRLQKGNRGSLVKQLRERLIASFDYRPCQQKSIETKFDSCLEKAVKKFQRRHGEKADGVVGRTTRNLLNRTVDSKIDQLLLNLDRIKSLPRPQDNRYIYVNIPEYTLHYYIGSQEIATHRVIVGDPKHPTPIFSDEVTYLTINPYWKLPPGIIKKEVVPEMVKNRNYLKKHGLELHETWEENSTLISPKNIKWRDYLNNDVKFPYRIMQPPGKGNALGRIKFKFPNRFSVYLHDTPTKNLFKKGKRAFSHGCIRLSKPFTLLESIAEGSNMNLAEINLLLKTKEKREIRLSQGIPINLIYLTAWVNEYGELTFGDDIYRYDKHQHRTLK
jgi:murein L,D-transpeptidase YcbB/YkuD